MFDKKSFTHHFFYIPMEAYKGGDGSIWINVMRDPVERFYSWYYFCRLALFRNKTIKPPQSYFDKDLETCVLSGDPECNFAPDGSVFREHQVTYFCGNALECRQVGNVAALASAKYHVEAKYAVVGVTENYATTLAVLEAFIPVFFDGVSSLRNERERWLPRPRNFSAQISEILRRNLSAEYELYDFVRQRLFRQAAFVNDVN